ncbi:MAG: hypothetical protein HY001_04315 [Candidatus Portnoybacteria bacterium]|nr:hypothetical protein [Candidatus Portnoybacteria bacterium]
MKKNQSKLPPFLKRRMVGYTPWDRGLFLCILAIIIGVLGILFLKESPFLREGTSLQKYASQVLIKCASSSYRPACYDKEIPKLMDFISMEEAFEVTKLVQGKDPNYWYCHVLGHNISARETARDPDKWMEVLTRCPSGMCSNGCLHGSFQERFRTEVLTNERLASITSDLKGICEQHADWRPTGLEQASCYHAMGHLLMYMTGADIKKSLGMCDIVALKEDGRNYLPVCNDGVFMQIYQPLEPEDFALVEGITPTRQTHKEFCSQFTGQARSSCWNEGWPLYWGDVNTSKGLVEFCNAFLAGADRARCFEALFFLMPTQFKFDTSQMVALCGGIEERALRNRCFANGAARLIETDARLIKRAVSFCKQAEAFKSGEACYKELIKYSTFNFHPGSKEFHALCSALPDPWRIKCEKGIYEN